MEHAAWLIRPIDEVRGDRSDAAICLRQLLVSVDVHVDQIRSDLATRAPIFPVAAVASGAQPPKESGNRPSLTLTVNFSTPIR